MSLIEFDDKLMKLNTNMYDGNTVVIEVYAHLQWPLTLMNIKFLGL
jgi:hypothetical protein